MFYYCIKVSFEWGTTHIIEGSELTGGYTVICPCLLGFFKKYVLYSFDKRLTKTKLKIKDLSVVTVSHYLPAVPISVFPTL